MILLALLLMTAGQPDEPLDWAPPPTAEERDAAERLLAAETPDAIRDAAEAALKTLGDDNPSASTLRAAAGSGERADAESAAESLTFRPRMEAALAEGYPNPTRVNAIEVKTLPAYRMAVTSMQDRGDDRAFWSLFGHIQKEGIAMTTPVRMDYGEAASGDDPSTVQMAFLYRRPTMGTLGDDAALPVEVVDVPPQTVASIGLRGSSDDDEAIRDAAAKLREWVAADGSYAIDGPMQVNGYNGPMTPVDQRIAEVQLPVRKVESAESAE